MHRMDVTTAAGVKTRGGCETTSSDSGRPHGRRAWLAVVQIRESPRSFAPLFLSLYYHLPSTIMNVSSPYIWLTFGPELKDVVLPG